MNVDNPLSEEAMETDPPPPVAPPLLRKDSSIDPDGDEVMDAGGELYDEEGDVEIAEGDGVEEGGEGHVDADGDITPVEEADGEEQEYFEEYEGGEGDVVIQEGNEVVESTEDSSVPIADGHDELATEVTNTSTNAVTTLTTAPAAEGFTTEEAVNTSEQVDAEQASQGNVAVAVEDAGQGDGSSQSLEGEVKGDEREHSEEEGPEYTTDTSAVQSSTAERDEEHQELLEHEEEEHDADDSYDLITAESLPPILLNLPNAQRALFNPIVSEDGTRPPVWFAEKIHEFSEGTLTLLWSAIRGKLVEEGSGNELDEMVITEKLTDLKMGDSDVNLEDVTFLELVQMYHDCELPQPMELHVEFQPHRFITRFNAIQKELDSREVVYLEDEEDDEEEQDGEIQGEAGDRENEQHEGEDQGEGEGSDTQFVDDAEAEVGEGGAETGQLPVPLPASKEAGQEDFAGVTGETLATGSESGGAGVRAGAGVAKQEQETKIDTGSAEAEDIPPQEDTATPADNETQHAPLSPAVAKTVSQVIAEDDALIGSPEIRASDVQEPSTSTTARPTSLELGQTGTEEGEGGGAALETEKGDEAPAEVAEGVPEPSVSLPMDGTVTAAVDAAQEGGEVAQQFEDDQPRGTDQVDETGYAEDKEAASAGDAGAELAEQEEREADQAPGEQVADEAGEDEYPEEGDGEEVYEGEGDGDDQDPYGVDKYVEGVNVDEEAGAGEVLETANGEEEYEEYEEEAEDEQLAADASVDPLNPHGVDHDATNGHGNGHDEPHDEVTEEVEETSPAKRSRSIDEDGAESEIAAGKRAKIADVEVSADAGDGAQ